MKINSTPIPNSTVLGDTAADLVLRGEHPDKRSDKEFIELMQDRGVERIQRSRHSKGVKVVELNKEFLSFKECEEFFGLKRHILSRYLCGRKKKMKQLAGLTFRIL